MSRPDPPMRAGILLLLLVVLISLGSRAANAQKNVAIIGAGVGGASSAYFISQALPEATITIFEKDIRVGGRIENASYGETTLELGASILYSGNQHMADAVKALGLTAIDPPHTSGSSGIWDGETLVFKTKVFKPLTLLSMLWRYGFSIFRLGRVVSEMLDRFTRIYALQDQCMSFDAPELLWKELDLYDLTQVTMRDYMTQQGVAAPDSLIIKEVVGSINRVNYNQNNGLNALAGVVSLCPTVTGKVFSVKEGNAAMTEAMIKASHAFLVRNITISSVQILQQQKGYRLIGGNGNAAITTDLGEFDAVIVATPFAFSQLDIKDADNHDVMLHRETEKGVKAQDMPPKVYQTTVSTYVEGSIRKGFFHTHAGTPSAVFVDENATVPISSIASYVKINQTHQVYKIFSSEALSSSFLDSLFTSWSILFGRKWSAYPHFHPPEEFAPFVLKPGERLYYVNALETCVSAMEISAIAAKNIANLLAQSYGQCARPVFTDREEPLTKEL